MTDEEKERVLQMIFSEIRADHTVDGLKIEFRAEADLGTVRGSSPGATTARTGRHGACYDLRAEDGTRTRETYLAPNAIGQRPGAYRSPDSRP